jgi:RimK family alpha-L-glutamate ligase
MYGWLIGNGFVHTDKFNELYRWLLESAAQNGMDLEKKTNVDLLPLFAAGLPKEGRPDFVLFWDKDTKLCRLLEAAGIRTFNTARAIELCDDKSLTYLALAQAGMRQPRTILVPKLFHETDWTSSSFLDASVAQLGLPMIVKECFGSFGAQVYLVHSRQELAATLNQIGIRPAMLQEYISSSCGHDVRIEVVGGKVIAAMYRYATDGDFRANVTNGAKMRAYTPNAAQQEMAIRACRCLGLDFAGVDLLFGEKDEPILCEVNSNAHFIHLFECTGINVADAILQYIRAEIEAGAPAPVPQEAGERAGDTECVHG